MCHVIEWVESFIHVLHEWQDFSAGLLALLGAYLTVRQIRKQISQVSELEERRRKREEEAAKAALPLALSEVVQYANDCIRFLNRFVPPRRGEVPRNVPPSDEIPRIPDVISTLQTCARFADEDIVVSIGALLGKLQVQHSRLRGRILERVGRPLPQIEGLGLMVDAADLHAKASSLFSYGRNDEELRRRAEPTQLRTAFFSNEIYPETHPALYERLERHVRNGDDADEES